MEDHKSHLKQNNLALCLTCYFCYDGFLMMQCYLELDIQALPMVEALSPTIELPPWLDTGPALPGNLT